MKAKHYEQDVVLRRKSTAEVWAEYHSIMDSLTMESFGWDHEARYELMEERSLVYRELQRRGERP